MKKMVVSTALFGLTLFADSDIVKGFNDSNAIKIGNGKQVIIEFADPECASSRKSENLLESYDVTRYVILSPMSQHQNSKKLSVHILCSADPVAEYKKVMAGKLDMASLDTCEEGETKFLAMDKKRIQYGVSDVAPVFVFENNRNEGFHKKDFQEMALVNNTPIVQKIDHNLFAALNY
jgi:thiol:disulfide interchange protein DsbC